MRTHPLRLKAALQISALLLSLVISSSATQAAAVLEHSVENGRLTLRVLQDHLPPLTAQVDGRPATRLDPRVEETAAPGEGRELLIRFDGPVDGQALDALAREVPEWVDYVNVGYDDFVIHSPAPASFLLTSQANGLTIVMTRAAEQKPAEGNNQSDAELLHLESALNLTTRKFESHTQLTELAGAHPNDSRVLADLAVADERLGRWRPSLDHYNRSLEIEPGSIHTLKGKSYLHALQGPHFRLDQWYRDTSNEEIQWITRAHVREFVTDNYTVGATYEHRYIDDSIQRQRFDGSIGVFEGHRNRYEAFVERAHEFAATRLSLVGQEGTPGAALAHLKELPFGKLLLRGAYREPYWVFVEGLADEGTADRLQAAWIYEGHSHFGGEFQGASPVTGSVGTTVNRYGLGDDDHVAESLELQIELRYRFLNRWPGLSVGYGFDAEYVNLTATRTDINGNTFHPIPLENTQVHSWDVALSHDLTHHLHFDLTTGFSYDNRIGSSGPFVYSSLIYDTLKHLQLGLNIEFNQESNRGLDSTFTQFGGFLVWRF